MLKIADNQNKGSSWVNNFISGFLGKMKKQSSLKEIDKIKVTKLSWHDAEKVGLVKKSNYIGHGLYSDKDGNIDKDSVWSLEKDSATGVSYLVKNVDDDKKIMSKVIKKVKQAELEKKAEIMNLAELSETDIADLIYDTIMQNIGMSEHHIEFDIDKVEEQEVGGNTIKFSYDGTPYSVVVTKEMLQQSNINKIRQTRLNKQANKKEKNKNAFNLKDYRLKKKANNITENIIIFDNGGETLDRYTIVFQDGTIVGSSENPSYPQGVWQHDEVDNIDEFINEARENPDWLGKEISFDELPEEIKTKINEESNEWEDITDEFKDNKQSKLNKKAELTINDLLNKGYEVIDDEYTINAIYNEFNLDPIKKFNFLFVGDNDVYAYQGETLADYHVPEKLALKLGEAGDSKTLSQHAEEWWDEQGKTVPEKNTEEYEEMYKEWVEYAFKGIGEGESPEHVAKLKKKALDEFGEESEEELNKEYSKEDILITIDSTPQADLVDELFGSEEEYIDTPGFYYEEKEDYGDDILSFMKSNMGEQEFNKLIEWIDNNPEKVNNFMNKFFSKQANLNKQSQDMTEGETTEITYTTLAEAQEQRDKMKTEDASKEYDVAEPQPGSFVVRQKTANRNYENVFDFIEDYEDEIGNYAMKVAIEKGWHDGEDWTGKDGIDNIDEAVIAVAEEFAMSKNIYIEEGIDNIDVEKKNLMEFSKKRKPYGRGINKKANPDKYNVTILISSTSSQGIEKTKNLLEQAGLERYGISVDTPDNITTSSERGSTISWALEGIFKQDVDKISEILSDTEQQMMGQVSIEIGSEQLTPEEEEKKKKKEESEKEKKESRLNKKAGEESLNQWDYVKVDMSKITDTMPPYIRLLKKEIQAGEGMLQIYNVDIESEKAEVFAADSMSYLIGPVTVPLDSLIFVSEGNSPLDKMESNASLNKQSTKRSSWTAKIREIYSSLEEFIRYSETYGLAEKLGYNTPEETWKDNPMIQGSKNPGDYKKADYPTYKFKTPEGSEGVFETDVKDKTKIQKMLGPKRKLVKEEDDEKELEFNREAQDKDAEIEKEIPAKIDEEIPEENIEEEDKESDDIKSKVWEEAAKKVIEDEIDIDKATDSFFDAITDGLSDELDNDNISKDEYKKLLNQLDELKGDGTLENDLLSRIEDIELGEEKKDDDKEDKDGEENKEPKGITPPSQDGLGETLFQTPQVKE
jgi:hypothetical protein